MSEDLEKKSAIHVIFDSIIEAFDKKDFKVATALALILLKIEIPEDELKILGYCFKKIDEIIFGKAIEYKKDFEKNRERYDFLTVFLRELSKIELPTESKKNLVDTLKNLDDQLNRFDESTSCRPPDLFNAVLRQVIISFLEV